MTASIINSKIDRLQELLNDENAAARWRSFIENSSDDRLSCVNAFEQAAEWALDEHKTLAEFIRAVRAGIMILNWNVRCPMCGDANMHSHLGSISSDQFCSRCAASFEAVLDQNVTVDFTIHPSIRALSEVQSAIRNPQSQFRRATGLDCATLPAFREFFSTDLLSANESLQVRDVAIMFTDIKGSTQMYERLGDARAFRAVRRHFDALFESVHKNRGAVVKTIGDAVMASFTRPADAMRAALDAQEAFEEFRPLLPDSSESILVKIGIHHGPCIAVTLNERLDFFGSSVNIAARTQGEAQGGETAITEAMHQDVQANEMLKSDKLQIMTFNTRLRGLSENFLLYKITPQNIKKERSAIF